MENIYSLRAKLLAFLQNQGEKKPIDQQEKTPVSFYNWWPEEDTDPYKRWRMFVNGGYWHTILYNECAFCHSPDHVSHQRCLSEAADIVSRGYNLCVAITDSNRGWILSQLANVQIRRVLVHDDFVAIDGRSRKTLPLSQFWPVFLMITPQDDTRRINRLWIWRQRPRQELGEIIKNHRYLFYISEKTSSIKEK